MIIKESGENYLETIYMLKKKQGNVRSIDVATELSVTKPSVSVAMKKLREDGFIVIDKDGGISLTEKGLSVAERMYDRHKIIAKALILIGVSEEVAYDDSCKIEHHISDESFEKIKEHLEKHTK